jgi:hypothetical protein
MHIILLYVYSNARIYLLDSTYTFFDSTSTFWCILLTAFDLCSHVGCTVNL